MAHFIDVTLLGPTLTLSLALCLVLLGWACARETQDATASALPSGDVPSAVVAAAKAGSGSSVVARSAAGQRPHQLGPYTLANKIGEGAMGEVYRAWHPALGDWRAVKLLPRGASARDRERFEKEARLGAELRHPNTVSIFECGEARDGTRYYAMELLDGVSLQQLVEQQGPQSPERVVRMLRQLCAALQEAHDKGLVHRDIKPENVVLTGADRDVVKLIDFGLVEQVGRVAEGCPADVLVGTPLYMAPEAIVAPETVGPRTDLYGLGAVAYFLLRGTPVFNGRSVVEVCSHHLHTAPEPLSGVLGREISRELEAVVLSCLSKDPQARPASADELAGRLEQCIESDGPLHVGPLSLSVMRAQWMLDRLDRLEAVVSGAAPRAACQIAA